MPLSPEVLAELLQRHWGPLVAWVGRLGGVEEDIVQKAFIKLATLDPSPDKPIVWLYRVTRRLSINESISSGQSERRELVISSMRSELTTAQDSMNIVELKDALQQLDPTTRQIVIAQIWGNLTFDEISEITSQSKSMVWRLYQNGIQQLRLQWEIECPKKK